LEIRYEGSEGKEGKTKLRLGLIAGQPPGLPWKDSQWGGTDYRRERKKAGEKEKKNLISRQVEMLGNHRSSSRKQPNTKGVGQQTVATKLRQDKSPRISAGESKRGRAKDGKERKGQGAADPTDSHGRNYADAGRGLRGLVRGVRTGRSRRGERVLGRRSNRPGRKRPPMLAKYKRNNNGG